MKVYFVGSHSCGKTSLARHTAEAYGLPLITETARTELAERETDLPTLRGDLKAITNFQHAVFHRQLKAEDKAGDRFVSDRAFDHFCYMAEQALDTQSIWESDEFGAYMESMREGVIFFVRPHEELLVPDGTRTALDTPSVFRIDGMVKLLLELHGLRYHVVGTLLLQERYRQVQAVLDLVLDQEGGAT